MLQSPRLKDCVKTIGIDQFLRNSVLFELKYFQNIKKLYKHAGKGDNQQHFKDILESAMVSNPEGFTNNSPRYTMTPTAVNKPSARKSLCLFTKILDVKKKTSICRVGSAKSKRKSIKAGTTPWALKPKRKENSRINNHINKSIYNWIISHPQILQSPIINDFLKVNINGHT